MLTLSLVLGSFMFVFLSMPFFRMLALRLDIVDAPGARKIHKQAIPLLGGLAIYLAITAGLLVNLKAMHFLLPVLIGSTIIFIIGLVDDIKGASAAMRLVCQLAASLVIIFSGMRIDFLPNTVWGNSIEIMITLIWLIGITNAYNYLDGMDGLAAGCAVVNVACFAFILFNSYQYYLVMLSALIVGACLGFLPHNFSKKKVFLGDSGSTLLGFVIASIAIVGHWAQDDFVKITIPFLILGVPIFDMIFTTIMRIKEEKVNNFIEWLEYGGKDHFHHYLVYLGLTTRGAVIFIYFITLSLGISAIMVSNGTFFEAILTLCQASIIAGIIATIIVVGRRHRSGWHKE